MLVVEGEAARSKMENLKQDLSRSLKQNEEMDKIIKLEVKRAKEQSYQLQYHYQQKLKDKDDQLTQQNNIF